MRTLIVATQVRLPGQHGGTTHVSELAQNLGRYGEVLVLAQRGSTESFARGVAYSYRVPRFARSWLAQLYLPKALKIARHFKPDVIYERASSYGLGAHLSRMLGVPMICMVLDEHYANVSLAQARKIIATTEDVVPSSVRDKWVKVGWGANADLFHPDAPRVSDQELLPFSGTTIGYAGSFKGWHDLPLLLEVAERLKERCYRFLLVGDGPGRARLQAEVQSRGLAERFVFTGSVSYDQVPSWLVRADICVAPFRPERHTASHGTFSLDPLKMFEYLALGKPSITIDAENIAAILRHQEHAFLLPPGDADAWADGLARLMDDPNLALAMATRGRNKVLSNHTWAAHAAHLKQIFDQLLEAPAEGMLAQP